MLSIGNSYRMRFSWCAKEVVSKWLKFTCLSFLNKKQMCKNLNLMLQAFEQMGLSLQ